MKNENFVQKRENGSFCLHQIYEFLYGNSNLRFHAIKLLFYHFYNFLQNKTKISRKTNSLSVFLYVSIGCDFRKKSQYCYKNLTTGDIRWEYPENVKPTDDAEEMDISTTPPPNIDEQLKLEQTMDNQKINCVTGWFEQPVAFVAFYFKKNFVEFVYRWRQLECLRSTATRWRWSSNSTTATSYFCKFFFRLKISCKFANGK